MAGWMDCSWSLCVRTLACFVRLPSRVANVFRGSRQTLPEHNHTLCILPVDRMRGTLPPLQYAIFTWCIIYESAWPSRRVILIIFPVVHVFHDQVIVAVLHSRQPFETLTGDRQHSRFFLVVVTLSRCRVRPYPWLFLIILPCFIQHIVI
jgi:hypothetical protein